MTRTPFGLICLILTLMPGVLTFAQSDSLLVQNSTPIVANRYKDIDGNPYYFSEWVRGDVLRSDGNTIRNVWLNYNGYAHEMEIRSGDQVYTLDKSWHLRVDVHRDRNPQVAGEFPVANIIFQRGAHRDLADRYAAILFQGDRYTLIKDCDMGKVEKEFNDVGKNIMIQRFKDESSFYVRKENAIVQLRLQKKRIAEAFDNNARITEYINAEKLNLDDEEDLVRLIAYADKLE